MYSGRCRRTGHIRAFQYIEGVAARVYRLRELKRRTALAFSYSFARVIAKWSSLTSGQTLRRESRGDKAIGL